MATKRKDGRWQARISLGKKPNGKWEYKYFYGSTEEEAEKLADQYYNKYVIGTFKEITLKEYASQYIKYRSTELSQNTIDSYNNVLNKHIYPVLGEILIAEVDTAKIKYLLTGSKSGARTKVLIYIVLNMIFKEALIEDLVDINPIDKIRKPKYNPLKKEIIPTDIFWEIYDHANEEMKIILYLAWCTGLRVGEITGLQHKDISNNLIKVRRSIADTTEGLLITNTKSINSYRELPIPDNLSVMLKEINNTSMFLFPSNNGTIRTPESISKAFSRLCKQLGYDYRFHIIRHTHATLLAENGISPKGIQARLGHHSAKFSLDIYTHITDNSQKGIAELKVFNID